MSDKTDKINLNWEKRDSEEVVKNRIIKVGDSILEKSEGKKIVFLGYNVFADYMEEFLREHDRRVYKYYVDEEEHSIGGDFADLDSILYEEIDNIYILVITRIDPYRKINRLVDYGFSLEQTWVLDMDKERGTKGKECYDVFLGYTREDDYQGFTIFGSKDSKYKILTLGGSTTDATCSGLRSWSELLYNKIKNKYPNVAIWCGGMGSFTSSTELLKLIRDGICENPSMVISYSGFNDIYNEYTKLMAINDRMIYSYQMEFLEDALRAGIVESYNPKVEIEKIVAGNNSCWNVAEQWIENERMMKGICEINNIIFKGYFQPCRIYEEAVRGIPVDKAYMGYYAKLKRKYNADEDIHPFFLQWYEAIKQAVKEKKNSFITDLSDIFIHDSSVYTDLCHVYEKGNRKICNQIYKDIVTILDKWMED